MAPALLTPAFHPQWLSLYLLVKESTLPVLFFIFPNTANSADFYRLAIFLAFLPWK